MMSFEIFPSYKWCLLKYSPHTNDVFWTFPLIHMMSFTLFPPSYKWGLLYFSPHANDVFWTFSLIPIMSFELFLLAWRSRYYSCNFWSWKLSGFTSWDNHRLEKSKTQIFYAMNILKTTLLLLKTRWWSCCCRSGRWINSGGLAFVIRYDNSWDDDDDEYDDDDDDDEVWWWWW